jgi:hypothetical protein
MRRRHALEIIGLHDDVALRRSARSAGKARANLLDPSALEVAAAAGGSGSSSATPIRPRSTWPVAMSWSITLFAILVGQQSRSKKR